MAMTLTALYTIATLIALGLVVIAYAMILAKLELGDDDNRGRKP